MSQDSPPPGRWTHPLLLAVAGPLVGGIFAVLAVYVGQSSGVLPTPVGPSPEAQVTTTAAPAASATSPGSATSATGGPGPNSSSATSAGARSVLYGPNEIRFSEVDFDAVPPEPTGVIGAYDLGTLEATDTTAEMFAAYNARLTPWGEATRPRPEDCDDRLARVAQEEVRVIVGDTLCIQTENEAVAAVTINAINQQDETVLASVIVWSPP